MNQEIRFNCIYQFYSTSLDHADIKLTQSKKARLIIYFLSNVIKLRLNDPDG